MQISDFDYHLPADLIAQRPLPKRDASRMLVVDRARQTFEDSLFASLSKHLRRGDVLAVNNTRVFPARLIGERVPSGGTVEVLLLSELEHGIWQVLARPGRRLRTGARLSFGGHKLHAVVIDAAEDGTRRLRFEEADGLNQLIDQLGQTPLPPYIDRAERELIDDRERYQTVYASERGAIAAPTAGLHFTSETLKDLADAGIGRAEITLHVGYGTFEPVRVKDIAEHTVAPEYFSISTEASEKIKQAKAAGCRVVCVGTTTARALESSVAEDGSVHAGSGMAKLTIVPGHHFRAVDVLLTNFHLPRSSLLLLVSAFAGREFVLEAYRHAVQERYRFYSYGDCMLIL